MSNASPAPSARHMLFPLFAALIWSLNMVVTKMAADVIAPASIGFYRWVLAGAILTPFLLLSVLRDWRKIAPHLGKLAVLGALGMAIYQGLTYVAAATTTATHMGIITAMVPLITIALGCIVLREWPVWTAIAGGALSLFGLGVLLGEGNPLQLLEGSGSVGDALMGVAALSYALYGVLLRRWPLPIGVWQSLYVQVLFGILFQLPTFLMGPASPLNADNIPLVLYAGIFPSLFAPYLWMQGVRYLGPNRASIFLNLMPVGTVAIAAFTLGEVPHGYHIIGGVMALAGVSVAQWRPRGKKQQRGEKPSKRT
ncbi:DMT family transporter [Bordetella sp. 02P26C-1]|uniref:DMT family transporter n=1 Tax=Bordetella sp. 02P26C-1 TaxID=2683195 RepID=UPI0013541311|nr:DMT family transporter [Bordetella sp. 02P26C-1]MVW77412.1 EamA family transporter [Bordetella sp. 02P26C-1]